MECPEVTTRAFHCQARSGHIHVAGGQADRVLGEGRERGEMRRRMNLLQEAIAHEPLGRNSAYASVVPSTLADPFRIRAKHVLGSGVLLPPAYRPEQGKHQERPGLGSTALNR